MKLLLVSRGDGGQLRRTPWCGVCLRAGLFVDMFFEGRLHDDLNGYSLVTTPTGFLPADELLKAVEREPDRSLASWIGKGPSVRDALAEQWVREEVLWKKPRGPHRHPRYGFTPERGWSQARVDAELARLKELAESANEATPADACLAALAVLAGFIEYEVRPSPELIRQCGVAAWLLQAIDVLILNSLLSSTDGSGGGGG
jgi:hypothetical protein